MGNQKEIRIQQPKLRSFGYNEAIKITQDFKDLKLTLKYAMKDTDEVCKVLQVRINKRVSMIGDKREYLVDHFLSKLIELVNTNPELFHGC